MNKNKGSSKCLSEDKKIKWWKWSVEMNVGMKELKIKIMNVTIDCKILHFWLTTTKIHTCLFSSRTDRCVVSNNAVFTPHMNVNPPLTVLFVMTTDDLWCLSLTICNVRLTGYIVLQLQLPFCTDLRTAPPVLIRNRRVVETRCTQISCEGKHLPAL